MAKVIKLTQEHIDACYEEVRAQADKRLPAGTLEVKKVFEVKDRKAHVYFTPGAWLKMNMLLTYFDKEVGWYGVSSRLGEEAEDKYLIEDIVVYPQEVTAATVDMAEPAEMTKWRLENIADERLDRLYMHGHSHVNMGTTPSPTDLTHQREVLDQMRDDGFYIFMIYNKRLERTIRIYDMKKNVQFENADITVSFYEEGVDYQAFLDGAKTLVKDHVYNYKPKTTTPAGTSKPASASAPATANSSKPAASAVPTKKEEPQKSVQGMGWQGRDRYDYGNRFSFWYDDEEDEYWDPITGEWMSGELYREMARHGVL